MNRLSSIAAVLVLALLCYATGSEHRSGVLGDGAVQGPFDVLGLPDGGAIARVSLGDGVKSNAGVGFISNTDFQFESFPDGGYAFHPGFEAAGGGLAFNNGHSTIYGDGLNTTIQTGDPGLSTGLNIFGFNTIIGPNSWYMGGPGNQGGPFGLFINPGNDGGNGQVVQYDGDYHNWFSGPIVQTDGGHGFAIGVQAFEDGGALNQIAIGPNGTLTVRGGITATTIAATLPDGGALGGGGGTIAFTTDTLSSLWTGNATSSTILTRNVTLTASGTIQASVSINCNQISVPSTSWFFLSINGVVVDTGASSMQGTVGVSLQSELNIKLIGSQSLAAGTYAVTVSGFKESTVATLVIDPSQTVSDNLSTTVKRDWAILQTNSF